MRNVTVGSDVTFQTISASGRDSAAGAFGGGQMDAENLPTILSYGQSLSSMTPHAAEMPGSRALLSLAIAHLMIKQCCSLRSCCGGLRKLFCPIRLPQSYQPQLDDWLFPSQKLFLPSLLTLQA